MGVAETVRALAEAVDRAKAPTHPRHRICVELLRLMPFYRDITGLVTWESAYQGVLEEKDDEAEVAQLLWEVFDFGRYNMYGRFNPVGTAQAFRTLSVWLAERGVEVPAPLGLTEW